MVSKNFLTIRNLVHLYLQLAVSLERFLEFDPADRISAAQAISHPYFKDVQPQQYAAVSHHLQHYPQRNPGFNPHAPREPQQFRPRYVPARVATQGHPRNPRFIPPPMMLPYHPYQVPVVPVPVPVPFGFQPPAPVIVGRPYSAECATRNL